MTTRERRAGEKEGIDYFYVSRKKFENAINHHKMLE
ncbi:MAG: hypothetical protein MJ219_04695 [Mycoplasmoidaceae bacterium]|nr:hypothetical protein [Mycoplasmoidaceae bacterium]